MAKRSLKGLQVAFGIIGTIAAVVFVFAYGVSSDIYLDEQADPSQQGSALFASTVSGQDVREAIDSTTTLPASSGSDAPSDSVIPPAPTTQPVADVKQTEIKPENSDSTSVTTASDVGNLTDQVESQVVPDVTIQSNGSARLQEVVNENDDIESNQLIDQHEQTTVMIENIATSIHSDNRDDNRIDSTSHDDEQEEKKDKHDDHKSGKGDGHGHKHKEKAKGKEHRDD